MEHRQAQYARDIYVGAEITDTSVTTYVSTDPDARARVYEQTRYYGGYASAVLEEALADQREYADSLINFRANLIDKLERLAIEDISVDSMTGSSGVFRVVGTNRYRDSEVRVVIEVEFPKQGVDPETEMDITVSIESDEGVDTIVALGLQAGINGLEALLDDWRGERCDELDRDVAVERVASTVEETFASWTVDGESV